MRIPSSRARTSRGFTLIEVLTVVAIIGVLATLAYSISRAQARNVYLHQAVGELSLRATGLRSTALSEGTDYLLVVVDAPNNDASQCGVNTAACASYFILYAPQGTWTLSGFNPANPGAQATVAESDYLPRGARFYRAAAYNAPPTPFDNVVVFNPAFYGTCANGARCFAIRFTMSGTVRAEMPAGGAQPVPGPGFAFVLASDTELESAGGDHRGIVVGFPSGVVKSWPY